MMNILGILVLGFVALVVVAVIVLVVVLVTRGNKTNIDNSNNKIICTKCGCPSNSAGYCSECGNKLG